MTREEIVQYINSELAEDEPEIYLDIDDYKVIAKVLAQEPILDKIRAEIEQEYLAEGHLSDYWDAIDKCLQIVDKYKAESEDKE